MEFLMLIVLTTLTIAALPRWEYSKNWDYVPSGTLGTLVVMTVALLLLGRI